MRPPLAEPRATESIDGMIEMVATLLDDGHAYVTHGTVYFDVSTFPRFGELSHYSRDDMVRLARAAWRQPRRPAPPRPARLRALAAVAARRARVARAVRRRAARAGTSSAR